MIKNIKKIRFNIAPQSYGEMGHLEFFNKDVPLKVNMSQRTLTLQSGQVVNIKATASSEYTGDYIAMYAFNTTDGPSHSYACWCTSSGSGACWIEFEFEPAIPKSFANKLTFCCGQNHSSYPGTYTLLFIDENGASEQIGQPLYVNGHNGVFEWTSTVRCFIGKDGKHYFLRLQKTSTPEETV